MSNLLPKTKSGKTELDLMGDALTLQLEIYKLQDEMRKKQEQEKKEKAQMSVPLKSETPSTTQGGKKIKKIIKKVLNGLGITVGMIFLFGVFIIAIAPLDRTSAIKKSSLSGKWILDVNAVKTTGAGSYLPLNLIDRASANDAEIIAALSAFQEKYPKLEITSYKADEDWMHYRTYGLWINHKSKNSEKERP